jgi:hypothetical protein
MSLGQWFPTFQKVVVPSPSGSSSPLLDPEDDGTTILHSVGSYWPNVFSLPPHLHSKFCTFAVFVIVILKRECLCGIVVTVYDRTLTQCHVPSCSDSLVTAITPKAIFRAALLRLPRPPPPPPPLYTLQRVASITDAYFKNIYLHVKFPGFSSVRCYFWCDSYLSHQNLIWQHGF